MEKLEFYRILDNLFDAVYFVDVDGSVAYWNESMARLTGRTSGEMVGTNCRMSSGIDLDKQGQAFCEMYCPLIEQDPPTELRKMDVYLRHKAGHLVPVQAHILTIRDEAGDIAGAAGIFSDASSERDVKKRVKEAESFARMDALTRLPNRRHIEEHVASQLADLDRFDRHFGVLFLDIDRFSKISERFGYPAGDEVLRMIGRTLLLNCRAFDTVGRWESERFASVMTQVDREGLKSAAERFRLLIENSKLPWGDTPVGVTVCVGGTIVHRGDSAESIIARAEKMLKQAKKQGGDRVVVEE